MTIKTDTDKLSEETSDRRMAVKKILGGAGVLVGGNALPDRWINPVISTAVIPAHASTSACASVTFEAGADESIEVGNVEIDFTTSDTTLNAVTWEATFSSEDSLNFSLPVEGVIETGNGTYSNSDFNVVSFVDSPAVGRELTVDIMWDGGSCSAETTVYDDDS
jgi:hypothetical protein